MNKAGVLYVVATPIGNLADISQRALRTLQEVQLIVAEDTRHSQRLLQHFGLSIPLRSLHEQNEQTRVPELLELLRGGQSIALISDAGTPLVRDPGYHLVCTAHENNIKVVPVPGACAAIAALSVAGLPADRFVFEGFLPARRNARLARLQELAPETRTLIFYEAPHRIKAMLQDLITTLGEQRTAVLAKELTKLFETVYRAPLGQLLQWLAADESRCQGEFVILVAGADPIEQAPTKTLAPDQLLTILLAEMSLKQAVKITSQVTGLPKNKLYDSALQQVKKT